MTTGDSRARFDHQLGRLLGAARRRVALHGSLAVAAAAGLLFGGAAWALGGEAASPGAARAGLLVCAAALLGLVAWTRLVVPLRRLRDRAALCRALEAEGDLDNLLVAAEEAARLPSRWGGQAGVPGVLVERVFAAAHGRAAALRLGRRLPLPYAWLALFGTLAAAGLLVAGATVRPDRLGTGATRLFLPWRGDAAAPGEGLYLADPPREAVAGSDVGLAARDLGRGRTPATCEVRVGTGLWQPVPCARTQPGPGAPFTLWRSTLPAVRESFVFRFGREGVYTPEAAVTVVHPPLLSAWGGTLHPPAYTRLPAQTLAQLPARLQAPEGSRLAWVGIAAGAIARAAVVRVDGDTLPLSVRGDSLRGVLSVHGEVLYTVVLRNARGLENAPRVTYAVQALPDAPPVVTLARPGDDGRLPAEGHVALEAGASDDYGLARLDLLVRRDRAGDAPPDSASAPRAGDEGWCRVTIWPPAASAAGTAAPTARGLTTPWGSAAVTPGPPRGAPPAGPLAFSLAFEAAGLELATGDVLAICLEGIDGREPGPPGRGRSAVVRLALPSAAEVLADQAGAGKERVDALEGLRRRSEDMARELEKLDRELRQDPQPGWERRQQLQAALERQRALQEEFQRTAEALQQDMDRLEQANLNSVELLEKMREVADLVQQVHSEELDGLLAQLRDQAASLSPEQVQQAMEQIARNQEEYKERLDKAIGLLKEMAREQQMEGLTAVVEKLLREQQALLDAARADSAGGRTPADRPDAGAQAQRQAALAEEARRLEERLREALDRLEKEKGADASPTTDAMRQALQEALRQLAERKLDETMTGAAQGLRSQAPPPAPSAPQQQEQAMRQLAALYHVLLRGQMDMQGAMQQYTATNLRRIASDLIALSEREEAIAGVVPAELRGVAVGDLARRQNRVLKAARGVRDRLQAVGAQSPALSLRLVRDLDGVVTGLDVAVQGLEQGFGPMARRQTRESVGQMNRIVIGLLTAAQQSGAGGGGGSPMPMPSEQLQRMAQEQAGLNALGQEMQRRLQEQGLGQETRAGMQRLQTEQGGMAARLQDLAEQERGRPAGERVLGDLGQLAQDMERVADDLGAGRLGDDTLARQERILSRLLDAHNSVRKRDFTQRRESRSAQVPFAPQAGEAGPPAAAGGTEAFRRRREPVEKAPADYRDLVRRYYRALEQLIVPDATAPAPPPPVGGGTP